LINIVCVFFPFLDPFFLVYSILTYCPNFGVHFKDYGRIKFVGFNVTKKFREF